MFGESHHNLQKTSGNAYVFFRESLSVVHVLVIDAENLCQSLIFSTIKEYSLYSIVVKLLTVQLEFITIFPAFSADLALIDYSNPLDRSIGDTRPRSCRTGVANTAVDLSETCPPEFLFFRENRNVIK